VALRIRLAPSRHRGSWGTSLVEPDRCRAEVSWFGSDRQLPGSGKTTRVKLRRHRCR
jgi:hypothetical protein